MAYVGLRYPVFAPISAETANSQPTYGTGLVCGGAMHAAVSFDRSTEKMYSDDVACESDNSITGGSVTLELDNLADAAQSTMLGMTVAAEGGEVTVTDAMAPSGGFGYIRVKRVRGVRSFEAHWIYKVQFGINSEESDSRQDRTAFKSTTVEGNMLGVYVDSTGNASYQKFKKFDTESAAKTWLNGLANISST